MALARGLEQETACAMLAAQGCDVPGTTSADGNLAGALRARTRVGGMSLGDRLCVAEALRFHAPIRTADRPWLALAEWLGLTIHCLRPGAH